MFVIFINSLGHHKTGRLHLAVAKGNDPAKNSHDDASVCRYVGQCVFLSECKLIRYSRVTLVTSSKVYNKSLHAVSACFCFCCKAGENR